MSNPEPLPELLARVDALYADIERATAVDADEEVDACMIYRTEAANAYPRLRAALRELEEVRKTVEGRVHVPTGKTLADGIAHALDCRDEWCRRLNK